MGSLAKSFTQGNIAPIPQASGYLHVVGKSVQVQQFNWNELAQMGDHIPWWWRQNRIESVWHHA